MHVVNLFGAPGSGKTTAALGLANYLKMKGFVAEYVPEVAKRHIWEGTTHLLKNQNLVFAQQEVGLSALEGQVDFAIVDAPLMMSSFYAPKDYPKCFDELCLFFFNSYKNINIFLLRDHYYAQKGRIQNEQEALKMQENLQSFLSVRGIVFEKLFASEARPERLAQFIEQKLGFKE